MSDFEVGGLIFSCVTRMEPPFEDPQFCRDLAEIGCRKLWFGHETVSDRVLDRMGKWPKSFSNHRERTLRVMQNLSQAGVGVHLFVMLGYVSETEEEIQENHTFLQLLCDNFEKDFLTFSVGECMVPTTSPLWWERDKLGLQLMDQGADLDMPLQLGFTVEGGVTKEIIRAQVYRIREDLAQKLAGSAGQRCSIPNEINATFYHPLYIDALRRKANKHTRIPETEAQTLAASSRNQSTSLARPEQISWEADELPPRLGRGLAVTTTAFPISTMLQLGEDTRQAVAESGYCLSSNFWLNPEYRDKLNFRKPGEPLQPEEEMAVVRFDRFYSILGGPARTIVEWIWQTEQHRNNGAKNATLGDLLDGNCSQDRQR